jgi:hypothetical protein
MANGKSTKLAKEKLVPAKQTTKKNEPTNVKATTTNVKAEDKNDNER